MIYFASKLIIEPLTNHKWELQNDLVVSDTDSSYGQTWVIPKGFITDLASSPRPIWAIIPPTGRYIRSAVLHDYLYTVHTTSRKRADKLFYQSMKNESVPWWKRKIMYYAVRWFGRKAWKS